MPGVVEWLISDNEIGVGAYFSCAKLRCQRTVFLGGRFSGWTKYDRFPVMVSTDHIKNSTQSLSDWMIGLENA
jgi:hypothetical protein